MKIFQLKLVGLFVVFLVLGVTIGRYWAVSNKTHDQHSRMHEMSMGNEREMFISMKNQIIGNNISDGKYKCCLEKPCVYCIEKTPGHGEGPTCSCLEDVMNGRHPCGECIGEILEGHGNHFLAKYFATAIAEEVGEEHKSTIKQIISEKYGTSIEEQI